ncbi:probable sulfite/nitrite reductase (ferredoxin) [Natronomonas pharaonis DSM 2160]|uniref:Probable sulfite/nitrite reductase (Ferredoxin) n=1 Tax=Natronomonas pharaonis (strain ATCC 35678 / DSM 2160 / CIP 103997 / JCM 8858 / NBRC 14720 / NCIMB 2260 / Gabara) TaxID=348780 RepID=A0A1U7EUK5_NATPD|nr:ferredoxin--nitrite reductase [Natronomonas pharaonis]CAI48664.1 probable sulfite/nitrite reductase (ferredoxin) [Natronomonas pharaonis DSM 2160]
MPSKVEAWKDEVYGTEIRDHLFEFAEEGWSAIPEDERDAWFERFKWWGLYHQRKGQESYFMMRIGTPNGRLTPDQLRVVGEIADEYARGPVDNPEFGGAYCDWTTRQAIQLHWIQLQDVPEIFDKLEANGLSTMQACGDSWRNIVGSPMTGRDAKEHINAWPVIKELNETFKGNDDHSNLPRKWKVAVTGDTRGSGQAEINDLGFEPAVKEIDGTETKGFNIRVGGGLSRKEPRFARDIDVFVTPGEVADVAGGISALFRDHGDREDRFNARIKFLVDEWGTEKLRRVLQEDYVDFELKTAGEDLREQYSYNAGRNDEVGDYVGVHEQTDGNYFVGLSVLVGRMGAQEVIELADLADEYGSELIGLTQRQNIVVADIAEEDLDAFLEEDLLEYHSPDPHPFLRGSIACTGTEFCSLSIVETKNRMVRYARWLKDNVDVPEGVSEFHIHLSGCTASCAQPQIADISLRGMKTRKDGEPVEAFDIGLGGGLGENPQFADWVEMRVAADEVPGYIQNLLAVYEAEREGDESFREFIARHGEDELGGLAEPEETSYEDPYLENTKMTWYPYAEETEMDASPAPSPADD